MRSLDETTDGILAYLEANLPHPVIEMEIPSAETTPRNDSGSIDPYCAVQFGDIIPEGRRNMATPLGDDYQIPIYLQFVAAEAKTARRMYNKGLMLFLGQSFPFSGSVHKRVGGGMFALNASNGATEAYMYPASFKLLTQLLETS